MQGVNSECHDDRPGLVSRRSANLRTGPSGFLPLVRGRPAGNLSVEDSRGGQSMRQIPTFRAGAAAFAAVLFAAAGTLATHARANDKPHGNGKYGNDGEILVQLVAIDENEVHAAQLAEKKDVEGAVESYAKMILEDHG